MWMLVRANAAELDADGVGTLAACPDTGDRGEPWLWSVRRVLADAAADAGAPDAVGARWRVVVDHDPDQVDVEVLSHRDEVVELTRTSGEEVVVVPLAGEYLVAHATGPWRRWVAPGDVFVVEGEDTERLRLTPAPGGASVTVVRLRPTRERALRWVP